MMAIKVEPWEGKDRIITINGRPTGQCVSAIDGRIIVNWLKTTHLLDDGQDVDSLKAELACEREHRDLADGDNALLREFVQRVSDWDFGGPIAAQLDFRTHICMVVSAARGLLERLGDANETKEVEE